MRYPSGTYKLLLVGRPGDPIREIELPKLVLLGAVFGLAIVVFLLGFASSGLTCASGPGPETSSVKLERRAASSKSSRRAQIASKRTTAKGQALAAAHLPSAVLSQKLASECPPGMLFVKGEFCPRVRQRCLSHADPEGSLLRKLRCAEYEEPTACTSHERVHLAFCIDRDEHVSAGAKLPSNFQSFEQAARTCKKLGKRLCSANEWTFACEGETMQPYSYGFSRKPKACNQDQNDLVTADGNLKDLRKPPGAFAACVSPFGVRDMTGNIEEWVLSKGGSGFARKGAFWQPGANHCRAENVNGGSGYRGVETGFRCCADPLGHEAS